MEKRILAEVTNQTPIFRNIATLRDMNINLEVLANDSEKFISAIDSYREELAMNSGELKVVDLLTEQSIMNGVTNPKLLEALSKIGATVENLQAFKTLGFTTELPEINELNKIMVDAYTPLRTVVTKLFEYGTKDIVDDNMNSTVLNIFRLGIIMVAEPFLSFEKYAKVKGINLSLGTELELESTVTNNLEGFNEWKASNVELILLELFETPLNSVLVAPMGIEIVFNTVKEISPELFDTITDYGKDVDNLNFARDPKFHEAVKSMAQEDRVRIIEAIKKFQDNNTAGVMNTQSGPINIPAAVTMPDVIIGALLHTGEVIASYDTVVAGSISEMMDAIESDEVKTIIDLVEDELRHLEVSTVVAVNLVALSSRFVPMHIFQNPMMRLSGVVELRELTNNISDIIYKIVKPQEDSND